MKLLLLLLLFLQGPVDKKTIDLELPPDLTHIERHGLSYLMDCSTVSVEIHESKIPPHDEYVCQVTVKVSYDDDRKPWTQPIIETRDLNEEKAMHEANLAGERWMAKIKRAVAEDQKKRGHEKKS